MGQQRWRSTLQHIALSLNINQTFEPKCQWLDHAYVRCGSIIFSDVTYSCYLTVFTVRAVAQTWPWVGLTHGLGWVGLGWVEFGQI